MFIFLFRSCPGFPLMSSGKTPVFGRKFSVNLLKFWRILKRLQSEMAIEVIVLNPRGIGLKAALFTGSCSSRFSVLAQVAIAVLGNLLFQQEKSAGSMQSAIYSLVGENEKHQARNGKILLHATHLDRVAPDSCTDER